jgi:hypothetical protein
VVVTAVGGYVSRNLRALWIQDDRVVDGRYAGAKVVYNPNSNTGIVPERGMRIDIEGEIIEYRRGLQIQYPTMRRNGSSTTDLQPIVVSSQEIARNSMPENNPYEGVLVRIENAVVTTPCLEDSRARDHGNWIVNGNVYVGSAFEYYYDGDFRPASVMCLTPEDEPTGMCSCSAQSRPNDQRMLNDTFRSLSGVTDFAFDEFQLQPRGDLDLVW